MTENDHGALLEKLGKDLGLELKWDEEGLCELTLEEDIPVSLKSCPEDGIIILSSVVAEDLPDPCDYPLVLDLLSMALGPCVRDGGNSPVVGRDPDTGMVVIYQVVTASRLAQTPLTEIFNDFAEVLVSLGAGLESAGEATIGEKTADDIAESGGFTGATRLGV
ncbi:MAG: CesT family type III secretion system chaperone [Succinivibrionaceae bacterium]|nr:CesT family type III secretion system chaperone [Succinivibrionaceae bacterium]